MEPLKEPMTLQAVNDTILTPMFRDVLPCRFDSPRARLQMLAMGRQESRFKHRVQVRGPARGFWQHELGTAASKGGVYGIYLHPATAANVKAAAVVRGVEPTPRAIYNALAGDAVLAAAMARLSLYADAMPLPQFGEQSVAWSYYLRVWRPGKPHPETWPEFYQESLSYMRSLHA